MKKLAFILLFFIPVIARAQGPGSQHGVGLTCTETGIVAGFNFYRSTVSGGPYTKLNTVLIPSCAYEDPASNLATNTKYFYVATAVDSLGNESALSNESSVTTPSTFPTNPLSPFLQAPRNN